MTRNSAIVTIRPRRATPVLVCSKCLKRMAGGRKLRQALKSGAKDFGKAAGIRRPRVVLTGCMGICPKRAVTVASALTLQRGEYLLLDDAGQADEAITRLLRPEES